MLIEPFDLNFIQFGLRTQRMISLASAQLPMKIAIKDNKRESEMTGSFHLRAVNPKCLEWLSTITSI